MCGIARYRPPADDSGRREWNTSVGNMKLQDSVACDEVTVFAENRKGEGEGEGKITKRLGIVATFAPHGAAALPRPDGAGSRAAPSERQVYCETVRKAKD
jgi:hypothetical protein